jgi:predicted DCC family thiol-disulfide oxidoreductase YuxK
VTDATVLFDGDCGFCRWSADRLRRWDRAGRLRFVPLQAPAADALLHDVPPAARAATWHLVTRDGRVVSGAAAVPAVLDLLPRGGAPASLARRFPAATARAYRWVAEHRATLGQLLGRAACSVDPTSPPGEARTSGGRSSAPSSSS